MWERNIFQLPLVRAQTHNRGIALTRSSGTSWALQGRAQSSFLSHLVKSLSESLTTASQENRRPLRDKAGCSPQVPPWDPGMACGLSRTLSSPCALSLPALQWWKCSTLNACARSPTGARGLHWLPVPDSTQFPLPSPWLWDGDPPCGWGPSLLRVECCAGRISLWFLSCHSCCTGLSQTAFHPLLPVSVYHLLGHSFTRSHNTHR